MIEKLLVLQGYERAIYRTKFWEDIQESPQLILVGDRSPELSYVIVVYIEDKILEIATSIIDNFNEVIQFVIDNVRQLSNVMGDAPFGFFEYIDYRKEGDPICHRLITQVILKKLSFLCGGELEIEIYRRKL